MSKNHEYLEEIQKNYDGIENEIKSLKNKKKDFLEKLKNERIFLNPKNNKFEFTDKVIGLFWYIDYNDRFVAERGMITNIFSGVTELNEQELSDFNLVFDYIISDKPFLELIFESELFKNALITLKEEYEEEYIEEKDYNSLLRIVIKQKICCDDYFLYESFLENSDFKKEEGKMVWVKTEEGYHEGTLNIDSSIEIKETTTEEINKTKTVSGKVVNP